LAEAFVGTLKRDYLGDAELRDAESVLAQLASWIDDYNTQAPHSACEARATMSTWGTTLRRGL
jgi:Integrase core domain